MALEEELHIVINDEDIDLDEDATLQDWAIAVSTNCTHARR